MKAVNPCRHGHTTGRYADGRCIQCLGERNASYRAKNADRLRAQKRAYTALHRQENRDRHTRWRADNQDKIKADRRSYHTQNRDRIVAKVQEWREANPDRLREAARTWANNRRARLANAPGANTAADRQAILKAQGYRCGYCRADLRRRRRHFDHIQPLSRGGSNDRTNIQALCPPCNLSKGAKDPVTFARNRGLLL